MLKIAYGEANFDNLRRSGELFIDKTQFISRLEGVKKFFFIRPRRYCQNKRRSFFGSTVLL
ncbi:MAG: AAA family ATPase [Leptospiraceae bacterium]|nr:AAA family ATPase [Leptospiraceae bacterium]MCP5502722.1 AAA family ATPase [Leptospiraceae bacterium]